MKCDFFLYLLFYLLLLLFVSRYYSSNNQTTAIFNIGDFCVAYSIRYSEFYRARVIKTDYLRKFNLKLFFIINIYILFR
jgi:hypothetical protein